jgi:membrane protease YdiL (CAAX protease family)
LLWIGGLLDSLQRPSVVDALSLRQLELASLAAEVMPAGLRQALIGADPRTELAGELQRQMEASELPAPAAQRLKLALLRRGDPAAADKAAAAERELGELVERVDAPRRPLLQALLDGRRLPPEEQRLLLEPWGPSPLLRQLSCEQLGGPQSACPAARESGRFVVVLLGVSVLPVLLAGAGLVLLLRRLWLQLSGRAPPPPPLRGPPLSLVDVTLLIAGGFMVLGKVIPELAWLPIGPSLEKLAISPALAQGLQVLVLYLGLMAAPLLILAWMLPAAAASRPEGGWLQWRPRPLATAFGQALAAVLMVLPLVALCSWLVERIWGDPGGSNPLLDMVLTSADPLALACFGLTATVLAPLFEETLFRGVLLPVLGRQLGGAGAVLVSAAVFAAAHLSLGELVPLFVLALGLGWLRWQSGRLLPCVLMHSLWNGLTFLNLVLLAD